jgi:hypothetical protein
MARKRSWPLKTTSKGRRSAADKTVVNEMMTPRNLNFMAMKMTESVLLSWKKTEDDPLLAPRVFLANVNPFA